MKIRRIISFFVAALLFTPGELWARKITFASPEELPPKVFTENGELKGTYIEIIREACKRIGVEPEFQQYPWARAVNLAKNGKVDAVFPPFKTPERDRVFYFPESVSVTRNVIFAPKDRHLVVKSMEDLKGLTVGINDQYSYGDQFDAFKSQLQLDSSLNEELLIQKLIHKSPRRIDVAAASEEAFKFLNQRRGLQDEFEEIYTISENKAYVAFTKAKDPEIKEVSESFGKAILQMKKEGTIKKITAKYIK